MFGQRTDTFPNYPFSMRAVTEGGSPTDVWSYNKCAMLILVTLQGNLKEEVSLNEAAAQVQQVFQTSISVASNILGNSSSSISCLPFVFQAGPLLCSSVVGPGGN